MSARPSTFSAKRMPVENILPLRAKILRPGLPLKDAEFPCDHLPSVAHFGAIETSSKKIASVATIYPELLPDIPGTQLFVQKTSEDFLVEETAWRLRGMATDDTFRGQGAGGVVLQAVIDHARASGAKIIWAHARTPAVAFYRRHGFQTFGEEYTLLGVGPHYLICLIL